MRWKFSTAADQRMMCAVVIVPLSSEPSSAPICTSSKRTGSIALAPDQRLAVDHEQLAGFGPELGLHDDEQHGAALALLQLHVGVTGLRNASLADRQASVELDLVPAVEQALERRADRREAE